MANDKSMCISCGKLTKCVEVTDHPDFHDGPYCEDCNPWSPAGAGEMEEILSFPYILPRVDCNAKIIYTTVKAFLVCPGEIRFVLDILDEGRRYEIGTVVLPPTVNTGSRPASAGSKAKE